MSVTNQGYDRNLKNKIMTKNRNWGRNYGLGGGGGGIEEGVGIFSLGHFLC